MSTARRGIGYIRVSRVAGRDKKNDGESFLSPEIQRERILAIAKAHGVKIVEWYEDRDQSGKTDRRPGYQRALAAAEASPGSVIVVARLSRFARSVLRVEEALGRLEAVHGQLVAGDLNIDTTTPQGRLMRTILAAIAQFELEVKTEQWAEAKAKAMSNGIKIANRAPLGYRWNADDAGIRVDPERPARSLVPDPILGVFIGELFRMRAGGASATELVEHWAERTGERQPRQTLMYALRNRAYLGEARQGELVEEGAHEPLVSPEEFEAAQAMAGKAPRPPRKGGEGSLLAGILHCASCGKPMTSASGNRGKRRYTCQNLRADCPGPASVLQELADPVVEEAFLAWAQAEVEGTADEASRLEAALAEAESAEAEIRALIRSQSAARNPDLFDEQIAELEDALEAARARVDEVRASDQVGTLRLTVAEVYASGTKAEKRKLLAAGIERVDVQAASGRRVPFAERSTVVFR